MAAIGCGRWYDWDCRTRRGRSEGVRSGRAAGRPLHSPAKDTTALPESCRAWSKKASGRLVNGQWKSKVGKGSPLARQREIPGNLENSSLSGFSISRMISAPRSLSSGTYRQNCRASPRPCSLWSSMTFPAIGSASSQSGLSDRRSPRLREGDFQRYLLSIHPLRKSPRRSLLTARFQWVSGSLGSIDSALS
jgi:hypothetical protein